VRTDGAVKGWKWKRLPAHGALNQSVLGAKFEEDGTVVEDIEVIFHGAGLAGGDGFGGDSSVTIDVGHRYTVECESASKRREYPSKLEQRILLSLLLRTSAKKPTSGVSHIVEGDRAKLMQGGGSRCNLGISDIAKLRQGGGSRCNLGISDSDALPPPLPLFL
jgi:hypothetical protein